CARPGAAAGLRAFNFW
nr:immunoglobulin heavy chain junction region [Macaca mulatta]MOX91686.1 immunoglobulin heavy chain junction region [Macaca mulatta]MOX91708.1 immunoglobulin heavy chain junction region [Macaca mulatta]MOX91794.1 immunoglobulin heavy chain junction region [Macaca mulatta]MOX91905.1 immunoglobulin heavy chain junction region [Macaca mulatta]